MLPGRLGDIVMPLRASSLLVCASRTGGLFGTSTVCRFSYAAEESVVAVATPLGTTDSRGLIKMQGRLVPMNVRDQSTPAGGFELSGDQVDVTATPSAEVDASEIRDAEARLPDDARSRTRQRGEVDCA